MNMYIPGAAALAGTAAAGAAATAGTDDLSTS